MRVQAALNCATCNRLLDGLRLETLHGYVYVLSNPSIPGLLKIGMTQNDVAQRAEELSGGTGVPEPYIVEAYVACADPSLVEANFTNGSSSRKPNRDFFKITLDEAIEALGHVAGRAPDFVSESVRPTVAERPALAESPREAPVPWTGSFVKVKIDCAKCGGSQWFEYGHGPWTCTICGAFLRNAKRAT